MEVGQTSWPQPLWRHVEHQLQPSADEILFVQSVSYRRVLLIKMNFLLNMLTKKPLLPALSKGRELMALCLMMLMPLTICILPVCVPSPPVSQGWRVGAVSHLHRRYVASLVQDVRALPQPHAHWSFPSSLGAMLGYSPCSVCLPALPLYWCHGHASVLCDLSTHSGNRPAELWPQGLSCSRH